MANVNKEYLDFTQLSAYDTLVKAWANGANQIAYKSVIKSADGNNLYFYKKPDAVLGTDTPDVTIALGGGDAAIKLNALASVCGATWDSANNTYTIALTNFGANTDTIVKALNELKAQILALDSNATIATEASGIVTIKGGIEEKDGVVTNYPSAKSTIVNGYLHEGKFYEEDTYTTEITLETSKSYKDLTSGVIYNYTGSALEEAKQDIVLAKAATTGAAADISYTNTIGGTAVTNVDDALDQLATSSASGIDSKTIWGHDESSGQSDYAKVYKIYQGENDYVADRTDGKTNPTLKLTINIPKDKVLEDANIVNITFSNDKLYDGATDVTALIKGSETPTAADAGKYLKMVMQNVADPLYVNLQTFVDVYTVASGATEVQLALNDHEFSASIVDVNGTKVTYIAESYPQVQSEDTFDANKTYYTKSGDTYTADDTVTADNFATKVANGLYTKIDRESVSAALTRLDGSGAGSVDKKIEDAINALDTSSDVAIATHNSTTNVVTFAGSVSETNGVIGAGAADTITFTPITTAQVNSLFI